MWKSYDQGLGWSRKCRLGEVERCYIAEAVLCFQLFNLLREDAEGRDVGPLA